MAATVRYWKAGSTDVGLAASYHDGTYGASAVPAVSNIIFFTEGSDTITAQTASGLAVASGLQYVGFNNGFTGNLGQSGTSITVSTNTRGSGQYAIETFDYAAGGGRAYIAAGTGGIDQVLVRGSGKLYLTNGTINTNVDVSSGELDINGLVVLNSKTVNIRGGNAVIDYKASDTPTINMYGGTLLCRRAGGTINCYGGNLIHQVEKAATGATTINILGESAKVDYRAGNIGTLNAQKGYLTFSNAVRPVTITTMTLADCTVEESSTGGAKITRPATITYQGKAAALRLAAEAI